MKLAYGSSIFISLMSLTACSTDIDPEQTDPSTSAEDDVATAQNGGGHSHGPVVIGREVAVADHLADGEEFEVSLRELLAHGQRVFAAVWTEQEGGGRPFTNGVGAPLADPTSPLVFPRNMNRISAPDSNSCAGCHAQPFGITGGGGDFVSSVFVLAHRFDFATFDNADLTVARGSLMENGEFAQLENISDSRATIGMFGSGFIEMLARQMSVDMIAIRDGLAPGSSAALETKGVSFGTLTRLADGTWDTSAVEGLPPPSVATTGTEPPNLIVRPFFQAGASISLRVFTNDALNHHHGIQTRERFGAGADPDGDGFVDEATRADVTAAVIFQAAMAVPGRVIPDNRRIEEAVLLGERRFDQVGCTSCHMPSLSLVDQGWKFKEPNPFNPPGNLRPGDAPTLVVDLTSQSLPQPRLRADHGVVAVPAYTDLKLHDMCNGPDDPNREPLDMQQAVGAPAFFAGNCRFLTKKLWGAANEPPFFHHGKFATMREAIMNHGGEGQAVTDAYGALPTAEQDAIIEFLKTLQVLPPGTRHLIVNERFQRKSWPPRHH